MWFLVRGDALSCSEILDRRSLKADVNLMLQLYISFLPSPQTINHNPNHNVSRDEFRYPNYLSYRQEIISLF